MPRSRTKRLLGNFVLKLILYLDEQVTELCFKLKKKKVSHIFRMITYVAC